MGAVLAEIDVEAIEAAFLEAVIKVLGDDDRELEDVGGSDFWADVKTVRFPGSS